jgi:undecaprenyl-phosphate 4-deoxy-4-formamido-L-arabinose transferase
MKRPKELQFTSFWMMKKYVRDEIIKYPFPYAYFEGLILRATGNIANIEVTHAQRNQGASGYTIKRLVKLWSNFTSFSILPLRLVGFFGILTAVAGIGFSIVVVIQRILTPDMVSGWTSLFCISLVGFGLVSFFLGVIGEYIGRIFMCINNSPQFVIRKLYDYAGEYPDKPKEINN